MHVFVVNCGLKQTIHSHLYIKKKYNTFTNILSHSSKCLLSFFFLYMFTGFALYYPTNSFRASFRLLLLLRTLLGIASVAVTYAGLILAIEFVDGKWRTIAGMYNLFPLPISYMLISGIAYLTQDYRLLQICIALPGIFLCFL